MIEGHGDTQAIVFGEVHCGNHMPRIVNDIVVSQCGPFGHTCCTASELNIDGVVTI